MPRSVKAAIAVENSVKRRRQVVFEDDIRDETEVIVDDEEEADNDNGLEEKHSLSIQKDQSISGENDDSSKHEDKHEQETSIGQHSSSSSSHPKKSSSKRRKLLKSLHTEEDDEEDEFQIDEGDQVDDRTFESAVVSLNNFTYSASNTSLDSTSNKSMAIRYRDLIMDLLKENHRLKQKEFTVSVELLLQYVRYKQRFSNFFIMCESLPELFAQDYINNGGNIEHKRTLIRSAEVYLTKLASNLLKFFKKCLSLKDSDDALVILDKYFPEISLEEKENYRKILNDTDVRGMIRSVSKADEIFMALSTISDFKTVRCYLVDHIVNKFCTDKISDIRTKENQEYILTILRNVGNYNESLGTNIALRKVEKITRVLESCWDKTNSLEFPDESCIVPRLRRSTILNTTDYSGMGNAHRLSTSRTKENVISLPKVSSSAVSSGYSRETESLLSNVYEPSQSSSRTESESSPKTFTAASTTPRETESSVSKESEVAQTNSRTETESLPKTSSAASTTPQQTESSVSKESEVSQTTSQAESGSLPEASSAAFPTTRRETESLQKETNASATTSQAEIESLAPPTTRTKFWTIFNKNRRTIDKVFNVKEENRENVVDLLCSTMFCTAQILNKWGISEKELCDSWNKMEDVGPVRSKAILEFWMHYYGSLPDLTVDEENNYYSAEGEKMYRLTNKSKKPWNRVMIRIKLQEVVQVITRKKPLQQK
jgi:hypothetical protein